jgi:hypothetical protein
MSSYVYPSVPRKVAALFRRYELGSVVRNAQLQWERGQLSNQAMNKVIEIADVIDSEGISFDTYFDFYQHQPYNMRPTIRSLVRNLGARIEPKTDLPPERWLSPTVTEQITSDAHRLGRIATDVNVGGSKESEEPTSGLQTEVAEDTSGDTYTTPTLPTVSDTPRTDDIPQQQQAPDNPFTPYQPDMDLIAEDFTEFLTPGEMTRPGDSGQWQQRMDNIIGGVHIGAGGNPAPRAPLDLNFPDINPRQSAAPPRPEERPLPEPRAYGERDPNPLVRAQQRWVQIRQHLGLMGMGTKVVENPILERGLEKLYKPPGPYAQSRYVVGQLSSRKKPYWLLTNQPTPDRRLLKTEARMPAQVTSRQRILGNKTQYYNVKSPLPIHWSNHFFSQIYVFLKELRR